MEKMIKHLGQFIDRPNSRKFLYNMVLVERGLKPWLYIKTDPVVRWVEKLCKSNTLDLLY